MAVVWADCTAGREWVEERRKERGLERSRRMAFGGWGHQPQGMGVLHLVATMEAH